ncbi:hypothetical protein A2291_04115 [candidate division WOR-1 bacterium RIFOXYB2_FULL_42_35]|uniref:DUF2065 domain-containing protein n=1 Tax=candidate division WOR-1 bacterium RIFOXYC2_FULL_41_25 TaxID=1802586 RepID=A0A1F4TMT3_UNCSA|nr:MAG: hypothetical protein A2247_00955 [candidate division WOR-1 bacterium RIFOXYA2_FULL_41_14]OGC24316.1 MAG: hypothetical protein A2291_04115 [candidate division WOR-1 bacterium RIFOXYB2_FULL_42_35]OGC34018.1 MAG: hypothetical protein A2462_01520 [candidate division WOR-1 bacterium RIFOXYC2_FULL_41_25]OGC43179.1 MAG: hypothetical protein A2548_03745 [candidate division WOR-1 bacterium RIFOXYD2_FULL_41_8]
MSYIIIAGLVSLFFGLFLVLSPNVVGSLDKFFGKIIISVDEKLDPIKPWIGCLLLLIGAWIMYVALQYPDSYLTTTWLICLIFGLLFLFLPKWLAWLSKIANTVLFSTHESVMSVRKIIGVALIVVGIYIFYANFLLR